jgi:Flp pilus assembly protein protease CpaA
MSRKVLKFALVCLICIGVITLVVLLVETMSN